MSTIEAILTAVLSSAVSSGLAAVGVTWLSQRWIEHRLATALADRRSAFEVTLEDKRQQAQAALEAFKAQLTQDAEMRRQVAVKRVDAVLRINDATVELITLYVKMPPAGAEERLQAKHEWARIKVYADVLLSEEVRGALGAFSALVGEVDRVLIRKEGGEQVMSELVAAHGQLLAAHAPLNEALRHELQLSEQLAKPASPGGP